MKRLFFIVMALVFIISILNAQNNKKWYFKGSLQGGYEKTENDLEAWDIGVGVGIHKMIGKNFSLGMDFAYARLGTRRLIWNCFSPTLNFAYFKRIAENLYYIPEVSAGALIYMSESSRSIKGVAAGISPFGLEYRPRENLGLRLNIVNISYLNANFNFGQNNSIFDITLSPALNICYRF